MPMSCLESDLGAIFASSDFGEAAGTVIWKGVTITGAIFDDEDVEVPVEDGTGEIVHQAVLIAASSQFPGIAEKDPVTVSGRNFRVKFWKDDGSGVIEIHLAKV